MIPQLSIHDLAPGDGKAATLDLARFDVQRIDSADAAAFNEAYARLWDEFGARGEMERRETLVQRFRRRPEVFYEIALVREGSRFAAVRDHSAIVRDGEVFVHMSHLLVADEFRRTGLAGWMRALPIVTARECARAHGLADAPITLVAEMEYEHPSEPARGVRLRAYERAGFRKIDPQRVAFHQPDFRSAEEIDASGGARPLPFQLVIRQVGREGKTTISGARVRRIVSALNAIYAPQFRPQDMAHPALQLSGYPPAEAQIALIPPTR